MATLLTHQVHQQQQSSNYNAPNNLHHTLLHQGHSGHQGAHHFCKDCGVMFESQTSLEVHLSYHKENLLTRWANQDSSLDKSSNSSIGSGSSGPLLLLNPSSPSPIKRERSEQNSSVESNASSQYFHSMDTHPAPQPHTYLPPMYNNNTGDQHTMEHHHSPTTPGSFLHHQQTPVDSNNGQQIIMYENFNFQQQGGGGVGHHPLFSPNPEHNLQQQQAARDSAEILDLDSHKVHIYQQQQQQQQQGFFHRPYLPHLLPPLPPPTQQGGGWNGEHHFSRFSPAAYPIEPSNAFYPAPPTPTAPPTNNGIATYEIVRMDNPDFSPNSEAPPPSHSFPSSNGNGNVPFGHHSPYAAPPQSTQQVKSEHGSPPGIVPKAQRSPLEGPVINNAKNGGGAQSPAVKTKGWKGGECKRPKTYNCPACNKWFTSSGHLKRHYGTTLHKNSMKQLGENAEELLKQQPRKKGGGGGGNKGEPKAPKTPKAQKIRNNQISPDQIIRAGDEHQMKKEVMYGHENEQPMYGAPPPPSSPNSFNYHPHPYGLPPIIPPPTTNHLQQHLLQAYPPPPNNGNNYVLDFVPQQHQQPPPPLPPTTTYNNGFNHNNAPHNGEEVPNNSNEREGPLPPFSSVSGLSHYDPLNGMDTSSSSSFQQQNRVTPPYHPQQQLQQATPSPHNSHQGQADTSYDSLERSDPVSSGEGSLDGSLEDGLGGGGGGGSSSSSSGSTDGLPPPSKDLKEHFKQLHSNSPPGAPLFKCHTCGKRFPGEPALSDHLAKHGNDKPYKCELCPKQFNHKTDLNRHRLLHTGDRPFVCTQCGKGFIRKDHMSKHEETHRKKLLLSQPN